MRLVQDVDDGNDGVLTSRVVLRKGQRCSHSIDEGRSRSRKSNQQGTTAECSSEQGI